LVAAGVAACASHPSPAPLSITQPTTYSGTLPCADCSGQLIVLTLFADSTFRMRTTYLGVVADEPIVVYSLGRWGLSADQRVVLRSDSDVPQQYQWQADGALRQLDRQGRPIVSTLNYELTRQTSVDLVAGPMPLRGMYMYMADAASLNECRTGRRVPVLIEQDHLALERAYLSARTSPGQPMLVSFIGRFVERVPEPGMPSREFLQVDEFQHIWPGESCAADALSEASLSNTRWRLVAVNDAPIALQPDQREPYLRLITDGQRAQGFAGCNQFSGGFTRDGGSLRFGPIATTRMMCGDDVMDVETQFLSALAATRASRIVGEALQLSDEAGIVRLRFESLYLN